MRFLLFLLPTATALGQVETLSLDGVFLGSPATAHYWLPKPCPDGRYQAGLTVVEVREGKVVLVEGAALSMGHHSMAEVGGAVEDLRYTLGKPSRTLFGCGPKGGQQVLFYDPYGLVLRAEEGKVQGIVLKHPESP